MFHGRWNQAKKVKKKKEKKKYFNPDDTNTGVA